MAFDKEQIAITLQHFAQTPDGEKVIGWLLDYCHVYHTSMSESGDPYITSLQRGPAKLRT